MIKIGITGGIGSGKSVISRILNCMGIPVFDTDQNAKYLQVHDEKLKANIITVLGESAYLGNGSLNKPYIASKIFNDKALLEKINSIVHPAVLAYFEKWVEKKKNSGYEIVGLESAILHEAKLNNVLDYVWYVDAPVDVRIERACKRDNKAREQIEARIKNQPGKPEKCDTRIINDEANSLIEQIAKLVEGLQ